METCKHLKPPLCTLASMLAGREVQISEHQCLACNRTSHPRDINEVVIAISGLDTDLEDGPGTSLARILSWFIPKPENCNCSNRVTVMNAWGPKRCLEELPTILSWLRESALDNNYKYSEIAISTIVKGICYNHLYR